MDHETSVFSAQDANTSSRMKVQQQNTSTMLSHQETSQSNYFENSTAILAFEEFVQPVESASLEIVTAALQGILKETDKAIQWHELAPYKLSYTTKNAKVNVERIIELQRLNADVQDQNDEEL